MIDKEQKSLWEKRLGEYESSSKSIAAWCQEQSIRKNQFYYWRKKLRLQQTEKNQPVAWLPVKMDLSSKQARVREAIAVHVGPATVEIKKGFDQHLLREIIEVLQTI